MPCGPPYRASQPRDTWHFAVHVEWKIGCVSILACACYDPSHHKKTHPHSILRVPTTQLANMSIDPKFVELTADVLEIFW